MLHDVRRAVAVVVVPRAGAKEDPFAAGLPRYRTVDFEVVIGDPPFEVEVSARALASPLPLRWLGLRHRTRERLELLDRDGGESRGQDHTRQAVRPLGGVVALRIER